MKRKMGDGNTIRDLSLLAFLVCVFVAISIIPLSQQERLLVYQLMIAIQFITAVVGFFGRTTLCLVLGGTQVCAWTAYRVFYLYSAGAPLLPADYVWLVIPILSAISVTGFDYGSSRLEKENRMLQQQVEDLVMVDALTGLYNLRTLYREIPIMINYCDRYALDLSLIIIKLRYEQELRSILPNNRFAQLCQRMSELVVGCTRLEDKVFAIGEGAFALLITSNAAGMDVVKNRLRAAVENPSAFDGIIDRSILVPARIGGKQYQKDTFQDPMSFKMEAESELIYDV